MAVLPIKKLDLCAFKKDRKKILEIIQSLGVLEVHDSPFDLKKEDVFSSISSFEKTINTLNSAVSIIKTTVQSKKDVLGFFSKARTLRASDYNDAYKDQEVILKNAHSVIDIFEKIKEEQSKISKILLNIRSLQPWRDLDVPLGSSETSYTKIILGTLPSEYSEESLKDEIKSIVSTSSEFYIKVLSKTSNQTCIFIILKSSFENAVVKHLNGLGFAKPFRYNQNILPSEKLLSLNLEIKKCNKNIEKYQKEIFRLSEGFEDFLFLIDLFTSKIEKYKVINKLSFTENVFVVSGFIAEEECENFKKALEEKFKVFLEFGDPGEEDDVPVILKNLAFCEPLEGITESYSLPGKKEVDPTFMMSVFHYALFGIMLSDAAYGLIIIFSSFFALKKFKNINENMQKNLRMFLFCGVSTFFWGVMFGSYFGDLIEVVSLRFFGADVKILPLWFSIINKPMAMLGFSLLIGITHIFTGLGMKLFSLIKIKDYKSAVYDVGFWCFLVGGLIFLAISSDVIQNMFNISFAIPDFALVIAKMLSLVGAIGIVLTAGRESRGAVRILKGLYGLYNLTGYLSDILSYSRLLALGLATGIIASVFNTIAKIASGTGSFGIIIFILIFLVGHALNMGLNLLGAYVHTNRLQFVEFFGKFYSGGGREFLPFKFKPKYFKLEDTK